MHIDFKRVTVESESDVEQKILMPLLQGESYLEIPEAAISTKQYLAPTAIDKAAGKAGGYVPDYGIWMRGLLIMGVEAKAPDVSVETGHREASLYARHINQKYPTGVNPCRFVLASNGKDLLFGYWDSLPLLSCSVGDLAVGSSALEALRAGCGASVLDTPAIDCLRQLRKTNAVLPS